MRLQTKFILCVGVVLVAVVSAGGIAWYQFARARVVEQAEARMALVRDFIEATHAYVREVQDPAVAKAAGGPFVSEAQSGVTVARGVFDRFATGTNASFAYREASDNPLNLRNKADPGEQRMIDLFRADRSRAEFTEHRSGPDGDWYLRATPIVAHGECLRCHGDPATAPPEVRAAYGSKHGYRWREGDVVGALVVRVPTRDLSAQQAAIGWRMLGWLGGMVVAALVAVYVTSRVLVGGPVRRMGDRMIEIARHRAYDLKLAEAARVDELGTAARAFNELLDIVGQTMGELRTANGTLEQRVAERTAALVASEQRFHAFMDHSPAVKFIKDDQGRMVFYNRRFRECFGVTGDEWVGKRDADVRPPDVARTLEASDREVLAGGRAIEVEEVLPLADGTATHWLVLKFPIADRAGRRFLGGIALDVTEQRRSERALAHAARHDALTGLPNRALFLERVGRAIERARTAAGRRFVVLFADLDGFKVINDSLGHAVGDRVLVEVARRLLGCAADAGTVPADVTIARLGGDEFMVLLDGVPGADAAAAAAAARAVADRVIGVLRRPHAVEGHEVSTSASVGIAVGDGATYETPEQALRDADAAMYNAKAAGKNRVVVFDPTMHLAALARLRLEADLRRAVERDELLLHYQPVVCLRTRRTVGFEALVRWRVGGRMVPPMDFIPVAEETGMIVGIGARVLGEACRQLAAWRLARPEAADLMMAVNVSRRELADPGFVGRVRDVLAATGVDPRLLKLEVTETVVMEDADAARVVLEAVRALGVRLWMDDFGNGYSSLSCLSRLPLDGMKLDRGFVRDTSARRDAVAVLQAVTTLAHNLGIEVVAEGLETAEHVALLQALECDYAQGFYFARPLPADEAAAFAAAPVAPPLAEAKSA